MIVTVSLPAYENTANETVTLPEIPTIGSTSVTVAPRNWSGWAGPRRLVTKLLTRRWWSMNHRRHPSLASSRNSGPSNVADAPRGALLIRAAGDDHSEPFAPVGDSWKLDWSNADLVPELDGCR